MTLDVDESRVQRDEFGLWLRWTLATMVALILGFVPFTFFRFTLDLLWIRWLIPLWAGALVGVFQWLALRPYLTHSVDWIVNGGVGWALGFALGLFAIQALAETGWGVLLGYLLFGLIIGVLQWPVLRREIPNAVPWVAASVLGWALGTLASEWVLGAFFYGRQPPEVIVVAVNVAVVGLVAGAITGLALVWIVRKPEVAPATVEPQRVEEIERRSP